MNIVCIAADLIPEKLGGAEVHAIEVIKRLALHHHIYLFVGTSDSIKTILPASVTVIPVSYPRIPNLYGLSYILAGYSQIEKICDSLSIDLIWAKQSYPQAILGALLKNRFHVPLYITAQNPNLITEELVIKGSLLKPFLHLFAGMLNILIKWSYQQANLVAAVSTYSKTLALKFGAKNTLLIPNGYDPTIMKPAIKKKTDVFTIVTTSSLIPRNGIDVLIKAVCKLPPNLKWQLLIAGDGPEKSHLKNLISNSQPLIPVTFLGRVNNKDIVRLLHQADLFVRPSRFEGFGVSFVEAMACGIPIIGTPVGGIPDFLIPNKTGLSVPVDDVDALTQAIQRIVTDTKLRKTLSVNGLSYVRERYTWDKIATQVESALSDLLGTNHQALRTTIVTPIYPPEIGGPASYVSELATRLDNISLVVYSKWGNTFIRQFNLIRYSLFKILNSNSVYVQGTVVCGITGLIGKLLGKKIIIKFVGDEVWEASGTQSLEKFYQSQPKSFTLWYHRAVLSVADTIVVPSAYLQNFLTKYHHISIKKIVIIPNAVEVPSSPTPNPQSLTTNYQLIFVGRLVPHKHVDEIIEAVAIARKKHPWTLTIVGDGPERKNLQGKFVTFTGQLSKSKTLKLVAKSRALILYSSYEGHPHTVLEAHALGIPTIVSDIPPHKDLGSFKRVKLHDPKSLASAINSLLTEKISTPPKPPTWSDHISKLIDVLAN